VGGKQEMYLCASLCFAGWPVEWESVFCALYTVHIYINKYRTAARKPESTHKLATETAACPKIKHHLDVNAMDLWQERSSRLQHISAYLDVPDDHRVSIGVQEVLALGIGTQNDGLAALGARQSCVDVFCN